jgi:SAM-dependent methyltransferase
MQKSFNDKEKDKVSAFWGQSFDDSEVDIYSFLPARQYFFETVNGPSQMSPGKDWFEDWIIKTYLKDRVPVAECLSICCGHGHRERRLAQMGVFQHCLGIDISEAAIDIAKQNAAREGYTHIDYRLLDLNVDPLDPNRNDLVYSGGALHHILNLEHAVDEIYNSLKPGGYLVCDEYIGPSYNDLSHRHREIINSAIHLLPERLRQSTEDTFVPNFWRASPWRRAVFEISRLGHINFGAYRMPSHWPKYKQRAFQCVKKINQIFSRDKKVDGSFRYGKVFDVCPQSIMRTDPSEGVRAEEIIPVIKQRFEKTNVHYYNGSVIAYALDRKCFKNYDPSSLEDRAVIDLLLTIEKTMIEAGEIPPIHAIIVSQKV